jgi:hypothetical protein
MNEGIGEVIDMNKDDAETMEDVLNLD